MFIGLPVIHIQFKIKTVSKIMVINLTIQHDINRWQVMFISLLVNAKHLDVNCVYVSYVTNNTS